MVCSVARCTPGTQFAQWRDVRRGYKGRVLTGSPDVEQFRRVQSWISGRGEHTVVISEEWRLGT